MPKAVGYTLYVVWNTPEILKIRYISEANLMTSPTSNPCRILTYGSDEVLLSTRQAILEGQGFHADAALFPSDTVASVAAEVRNFDLIVICHTISLEDEKVIISTANESGVKVYSVTTLVSPECFLAHIKNFANCNQVSDPTSWHQ